jgi:hypothetical protein
MVAASLAPAPLGPRKRAQSSPDAGTEHVNTKLRIRVRARRGYVMDGNLRPSDPSGQQKVKRLRSHRASSSPPGATEPSHPRLPRSYPHAPAGERCGGRPREACRRGLVAQTDGSERVRQRCRSGALGGRCGWPGLAAVVWVAGVASVWLGLSGAKPQKSAAWDVAGLEPPTTPKPGFRKPLWLVERRPGLPTAASRSKCPARTCLRGRPHPFVQRGNPVREPIGRGPRTISVSPVRPVRRGGVRPRSDCGPAHEGYPWRGPPTAGRGSHRRADLVPNVFSR